MQRLLPDTEAAPLIGVAVKTLRNWRTAGSGPRFIRAGRRIVYDPVDLQSWRDARRVQSTSEPVGA